MKAMALLRGCLIGCARAPIGNSKHQNTIRETTYATSD